MDDAGGTERTGDATATALLLTHLGTRKLALPPEHLAKTMRLVPSEPLAGAPPLRGRCRIRAAAVPVVDGDALAATPPSLQADAEPVRAVGVRDAQLLLVLRTTRLIPEQVRARLRAPGP
jgi:hypothetical protein